MSIHHLERAAVLPLQATRKLVFMALCDDADKSTGVAMPGIEAVMQWAGCGRSQAQDHLAALIEEGYVERVRAGARGRRAEYRVFARVACCSEHTAYAPVNASGEPDANDETPAPVDNSPSECPTGTTTRPIASGKGPERVRKGSGLDRTPPSTTYPPGTEGVREVSTSPAPVDNSRTSPHDELGGMRGADPVPLTRPDRCPRHQRVDIAPPCGGCAEARKATTRREREAAAAVRERQAARDRAAPCPEHGVAGRLLDCSGCAADHKAGDHRGDPSGHCVTCLGALGGAA